MKSVQHLRAGDLNGLFTDLQHTMKNGASASFGSNRSDYDRGSFAVTVAADLDCSRIPVYSEQICTYGEGFITGLLLPYSGKDLKVKGLLGHWREGLSIQCRPQMMEFTLFAEVRIADAPRSPAIAAISTQFKL